MYKLIVYSKKYLAEHEPDILLHRAAKKAFNENGLKKLPTVKSLKEEYARLYIKIFILLVCHQYHLFHVNYNIYLTYCNETVLFLYKKI